MIYEFRSLDHPEADGRQAQAGDEEYSLKVNLEENRKLTVLMGRTGMVNVATTVVLLMAADDTLSAEVKAALLKADVTEQSQEG